ncbi:TonB-dependent receptor [Aliiglaciecola sp. 2_MG-2023]|uniref:TonB-dependent receptor n=1 Tax=unclassified Aliiglaciecola TaxID=2593648 RepID=UPI0026E32039|nr:MULTISPECIES: TonB-dependent receptor [unclassified Aliiglaciecola]MDO6709287.1 TonB-dependent receptor [Aliiglaciecola sp. 2_MG-2023]MDO6750435.1 TonB-dependent receptor [Aliiglaciecola sp. 1_MG-2023]
MSLNFHNKNKLAIAISMAIFSTSLLNANIALAQESKKTAAEPNEVEVIEVKGILGSLKDAAQIKRYADTVVDAITSEDIGEFADDSIAGAIQRIPGVQIETDDAGTDGDRVSIRGLGPEFVNSTINGRRLLSSGNEGRNLRKMNFNAFPPSVLSGVRVTKGSTASRPESGLAGQIDLQTMKPLDLRKLKKKNSYSTIGFRAGLNDIDDETGFRVNALSAFRNDDKDLGGYFALVASEEKNARDQLRINWGDDYQISQQTNGESETVLARAPKNITMNPIRESPSRLAIATGIQYQPNEDVDINWDFMYSHYNNKSTRNQFQVNLNQNSVWKGTVFDQSEAGNPGLVVDENGTVRYANLAQSDLTGSGLAARTTATKYDNETKNLVSGINVDWIINDSLNANFDAYVSTLDYTQNLRFVRFEKDLDPSTFIYDGTGDLPSITAPDADVLEDWNYSRASIREISSEGENYGLTAAFDYAIDNHDLFSSVYFGIHFDRTDIDAKRSKSGTLSDFADEMLGAALIGDRLPEEFLSGEGISPSRYLVPLYSSAVTIDPRIESYSWDEIGVDPDQSYEMTEDIFAVYGQVNLYTEVFGLPLTGNVGMRAVYTDNEATALQELELPDGEITEEIVTTVNDYWTYLPSLNLNLALNENMALRLGLSRTMSRPDYQDTAPINRIKLDDEGVDNSAVIGNPALNPMSSQNLDITYEWYTKYDGAFVLSGFYKEIDDYIIKDTLVDQPLAGYDGLWELTTNINFSDGTAEGVEIGLLQPLEKLVPALAGFGFSVNYTYVDSKFDKENVGDAGFGFPGSSKDNFNFVGFYEADWYAIRLAYTYRGSFFRSLGGTGSQSSTSRFSGEQEKLNVNLNLKPMKNVSVKLSANNITGQKRRDFYGDESTFLDYFDRGRTYSVSVNYKF